MGRFWIGAAIGASSMMAVALGCGGSTSDSGIGSSGGQSEAGAPPGTPPPPAPAPPPQPPPPPMDAGNDTGNIDAPTVSIAYMATCPTFTACGGDLIGTWTLSGGCVDSSVFDSAKQSCPSFTVSNVVITAKGITTIDATTISQMSHSDIAARFNIPQACKPSPAITCASIAAYLLTAQGGAWDTANCTGTADCTCDVTKGSTTSSSDTYTATGGVMTLSSGAKFDFCVNPASTLTTRQQNANGTPGPATFTETK